jgi:hypothetical protein
VGFAVPTSLMMKIPVGGLARHMAEAVTVAEGEDEGE